MKLRTKQTEIEAVQWKGNNFDELRTFCDGNIGLSNEDIPQIEISEHVRIGVDVNQWIVKNGMYFDVMENADIVENYEEVK